MSVGNVAPHLEHVTLPAVRALRAHEAPQRLTEILLPFFTSAAQRGSNRVDRAVG
jgi:hypothetical protein